MSEPIYYEAWNNGKNILVRVGHMPVKEENIENNHKHVYDGIKHTVIE